MLNIPSVDVEKYFHPTEAEAFVDQSKWARLPSRVGDQVLRVVDLLEEGNVQATFFLFWDGSLESNFPFSDCRAVPPSLCTSCFDWGFPLT
jgi:hypothetical protein